MSLEAALAELDKTKLRLEGVVKQFRFRNDSPTLQYPNKEMAEIIAIRDKMQERENGIALARSMGLKLLDVSHGAVTLKNKTTGQALCVNIKGKSEQDIANIFTTWGLIGNVNLN